MNLCVLHLSDVERESGTGVDREELIQWYLEQKEVDLESEEDLEYERELIAKALTKLSKVNSAFLNTCGGSFAKLCDPFSRIITCSRYAGMCVRVWRHLGRESRSSQRMRMGTIRYTMSSVSAVSLPLGSLLTVLADPQVDLSDLSSSLAA